MQFKPMSGREMPRFAGIKTFFRLPHVEASQDFDVALFGIPYDGSLSYRPGARFAPGRIRECSSLGRGYHWSRSVNVFERLRVADIGDCPTVPLDISKNMEMVESFATNVLKTGKKFVAIGGDHSLTLPLLRSAAKVHGPVQLIHFDAHLDTYPAAWDCEYHHGAFLRHVVEEGLVQPGRVWQVGIRGPLAGGDDRDFVTKHGIHVITVDDIRQDGTSVVEKRIGKLGDAPTYITYDIDCLDPSCAPGTGTPVVGGLTTYEVQQIFRQLEVPHLVGADIVEVSPPFDSSDITSLAAVDALFEILCLL